MTSDSALGGPIPGDQGAALAVALTLVIVSLVTLPIPATAADQWPDYCHEAETLSPGTYSGQVGPNDIDWFALDLKDGEYISASVEIESTSGELEMIGADRYILREDREEHTHSELEQMGFHDMGGWRGPTYFHGDLAVSFVHSQREISSVEILDYGKGYSYHLYPNPNEDPYSNTHNFVGIGMPTGKYTFKTYSVTNHPICLGLYMSRSEGSGTWKLAFEKNAGNTPDIGESRDVAELREQLEQKNQRITELEQQVEDLQAQLEAQQGGDGVTINVEVSPGSGQQSYLEGGTAMIEAESASADLSQLEIQYEGNRYSVDDSGTAAIPLTETGEQKLEFIYGDTTEAVTLDVVEDSPTDGEIIPVGGPGFGMAVAIVALLLAGLLVQRVHG